MKKLLFICLCFFALSCSESNVEPEDNKPNLRTLTAAEQQVVSGSNDFAFRLFSETAGEGTSNIFISPLSVSSALAMTLNGASESTATSILQTIDYGDFTKEDVNQSYKDLTTLLLSMDKKVNLGIANSVWYADKYHVKNTFSSVIEDYFDGTVQGLNFSDPMTKGVINGWVEDKTNNRIKNLIDDIDPAEVMFLVNAIYFKADWTYKFDKSRTRKETFTTLSGSVDVDMMSAEAVALKRRFWDNTTLLDIPYGNEQYRFTILMPNDPASLSTLRNGLTAASLQSWLEASDSVTISLSMPKFTMEWKKDIKDNLINMGMATSGFPGLFEEQLDLAISRVIHQTFLEVNEEGSEAAAATAVGIIETSAGPSFTVNKPFLFMIREKHSGTILFIGQLTSPGAK